MTALGFAHGAYSSGWFGFERPDDRQVVTWGALNGVPVEITLDTGVDRTVIDAATAARCGIAALGDTVSVGLTGRVEGRTSGPVHLQLQNLAITMREASLFDLGALSAINGRPVGVVLGNDLFGRAAVSFDFGADRMLVAEPSTLMPHPGFAEIPLTREPELGRLLIPASLGKGVALEAVADLGNDAPLYMSAEFAAQHRLLEGRPLSRSMSVGAEGVGVDTVFTLPSLEVGGVVLRQVPTRIPSSWTAKAPAVIGLPIFARFDLTFCAPRDRLWMKAPARRIARPFGKDRSGLAVTRAGDRLEIAFVAPRSPASRVGLRPGDAITSVNGQILDGGFLANRPRLGARAGGARLALGLADGRAVSLILADYY
ncbi:aspartyl protease family protein [Phenylobacterium sp.]|uniref:aspartyl protease family protein n=1 Tax=Phenylobacterium sp. TaxID=1871053 RepID=UPI002CC52ECA|nr:aspartyl protease family protein [Phenylobacterium sp.]HLZ74099.1 aspartyl protease family protein [Phenylobacterium sp.]